MLPWVQANYGIEVCNTDRRMCCDLWTAESVQECRSAVPRTARSTSERSAVSPSSSARAARLTGVAAWPIVPATPSCTPSTDSRYATTATTLSSTLLLTCWWRTESVVEWLLFAWRTEPFTGSVLRTRWVTDERQWINGEWLQRRWSNGEWQWSTGEWLQRDGEAMESDSGWIWSDSRMTWL